MTQIQDHATVVSIENQAIALRGPSGSGKSDLALRLIDSGAILIADDRCNFSISGNIIAASPPKEIAGIIEIHGLGLFCFNYVQNIQLRLIVDLSRPNTIERMPEPGYFGEWGIPIPMISLNPFEQSATIKVHIALKQAVKSIESVSQLTA